MQRQIVIFKGTDASNKSNLWETNGTVPGTHELTGVSGADPFSGVLGNPVDQSEVPDFTPFNGVVLFQGTDTNQTLGLWITDGSVAGTHEVTGIIGALSGGLDPTDMTVFKGQVLFSGESSAGGARLWVTDGSAAGTHELANVGSPHDFTIFQKSIVGATEVLFNGVNASGQFGLWVTDGTAAGTHELTGISGVESLGVNPFYMTVFRPSTNLLVPAEVLFEGSNQTFQEGLWVTDGIAADTHEVTGISGASSSSSGLSPRNMLAFGHEVLFNGLNAAGQRGLWVTDGTALGTHELTGITGAFSSGIDPSELTFFNGEVLFNGERASGQFGLWVTDGTAAGTHELTGIIGGFERDQSYRA
jgi:ELWxxDGT repeat protein